MGSRLVELGGFGGGEGFFGGGEGGADFFFSVGGAEEGGFKLGGRQPDSGMQHGTMEGGKLPGVGTGGAVVLCDRIAGKEPGKHGADAVGGEGHRCFMGEGGDAICHGGRNLLQLRVDGIAVLDEGGDGGDSSGHGQRIAAERACLVDGAEWGEQADESLRGHRRRRRAGRRPEFCPGRSMSG